jgi:hypothetical protein
MSRISPPAQERNIDYLVLVEVYLARVFSPAEDDEPLMPYDSEPTFLCRVVDLS